MKGLYALQGGLALALWERGGLFFDRVGSSYFALEANQTLRRSTRHLGGFPFVQGSSEEGLKVGRYKVIQRMGRTWKSLQRQTWNWKYRLSGWFKVGGGGKREVKDDWGVVLGWINFDEIMGGGRHRRVNHTLKHGLTLGIIKCQPCKDLDQELLLLHSPLPSAHVGNLLVVWIAMLNQKPSHHVWLSLFSCWPTYIYLE